MGFVTGDVCTECHHDSTTSFDPLRAHLFDYSSIRHTECSLSGITVSSLRASHLRIRFRNKPLVILVQFLCRAGEPVVVSSPRSFRGATETRVSKAPVKSSQAEDVLFRKVCTTRQCLGCNMHSTCSHLPVAGLSSRTIQLKLGLHEESGLHALHALDSREPLCFCF